MIENFGPPEVLELREIPKPEPEKNEMLIRVCATTVNAADCNIRGLTYVPPGLGFVARMMLGRKKPKQKYIGSVVSGVVEATGNEVKKFKAGDRVFGTGPELGAYAEYTCRPEDGAFALIPDNIGFGQAASVPYGALTALFFLREKGKIRSGDRVLVHGASGNVGAYAVQLAKFFGAEVTGVCSTRNVEFVRSLGADRVIDYTREDYTRSGEQWDLIADIVVGKTSFSRNRNSLSPKGKYLAIAGGLGDMLQMVRTSITGGKKVVFGGGSDCESQENMEFLSELLASGRLKPVTGQTFPFDSMVEAHRYAESGQKQGNVVVTVP